MRDVNNDSRIEVTHLVDLSLPRLIPFIKTKNNDTAANMNDKTYAIILHHHGNENLVFMFGFLKPLVLLILKTITN